MKTLTRVPRKSEPIEKPLKSSIEPLDIDDTVTCSKDRKKDSCSCPNNGCEGRANVSGNISVGRNRGESGEKMQHVPKMYRILNKPESMGLAILHWNRDEKEKKRLWKN